MLKRIFDIVFSILGLIFLLPFFVIFSVIIVLDSRGGIFFRQIRVGKNNKDFKLIKFRTMRVNAEKQGQLTVGSRDARITRFGYFLRKFKVDELPQLVNVLIGDMSFVGPRPEVRKYVDLYTAEQQKVLTVLPGITDYASLKYFEESTLLAQSKNPEKTYVEVIMPEKLRLNMLYIQQQGFLTDCKLIFQTIFKIFSKKQG